MNNSIDDNFPEKPLPHFKSLLFKCIVNRSKTSNAHLIGLNFSILICLSYKQPFNSRMK